MRPPVADRVCQLGEYERAPARLAANTSNSLKTRLKLLDFAQGKNRIHTDFKAVLGQITREFGAIRMIALRADKYCHGRQRVMSDQEIEILLWQVLVQNRLLKAQGFSVVLSENGDVIVDRRGHVRGIWRSNAGQLEWTPAGYNEAQATASDAAEAELVLIAALGLDQAD